MKYLVTSFFTLFLSVALAGPRIDYETFMAMNPDQQKKVVALIMKAYASFEEVQKKEGITVEEKLKQKQSFFLLKSFLSSAYAQEQEFELAPDNSKYKDLAINRIKEIDISLSKAQKETPKENKTQQKKPKELAKKSQKPKPQKVEQPKKVPTKAQDKRSQTRNCIYAGWFSSLNPGTTICTHPARLKNSDYNFIKSRLGIDGSHCRGLNKMACNPFIFGHQNKKAICVAGNGKSYNSSLACWKKSKDLDAKDGLITKSIVKLAQEKPEQFQKVLDTVFQMCLCGKSEHIHDGYAKKMQRHRTCYGLLKQSEKVTESLHNACSDDRILKGLEDNMEQISHIQNNLTNFFKDTGEKFKLLLTDKLNSKLKGSEKELKALDEDYAKYWSSYRAEGDKCVFDKNEEISLTAEDTSVKGADTKQASATVILKETNPSLFTLKWICDEKEVQSAKVDSEEFSDSVDVPKTTKKCIAELHKNGAKVREAPVEFKLETPKKKKDPFNYTISIKYTDGKDPYRDQNPKVAIDAVVKDKEGKEIKDLKSKNLTIRWYKTKDLIQVLKERKKKALTKKKEEEEDDDIQFEKHGRGFASKKEQKKSSPPKDSRFRLGHKKVNFKRLTPADLPKLKSPAEYKAYKVVAVLVRESEEKQSNTLPIPPINIPTGNGNGAAGIGVLEGSF